LTAILGGFASALCFAVSALTASRAQRRLGAPSTAAWIMLSGLALTLVPGAIALEGHAVPARYLALLLLGGMANVLGLLFQYAAFRTAPVSLVVPVVATEGAIAAILAALGGQRISAASWLVLSVIVSGVVLGSQAPADEADARLGRRGLAFSLAAACLLGTSFYIQGDVGKHVPLAISVLPARLAGAVLLALPLLVAGRLRMASGAMRYPVAAGIAEALGFVFIVLGSRQDVAVTAVLSSQFSLIAVVVAYFLFGERLGRRQRLGIALVTGGVTGLVLLQGG
jgi:drug/metabolite transporter (DMT)-like permease